VAIGGFCSAQLFSVRLTRRNSEMIRSTNRFRSLVKLSLLALIFYFLYLVRNQVLFESFLESSYISFSDFPPTYADALKNSVLNHTDLEFDYSIFRHDGSESSSSVEIPRIIHFIWFKGLYDSHDRPSDIPASGSNAPELCRNHNPNYTINVWNATAARNLLETNYGWFLPTYDSYKYPIQRVDALKYFLLWHYGGVYMDLDIACRRPLDPLLAFPAWFPRASPLGVNNDLMASAAGHPIIGKMTSSLQSRNKWLVFTYLTVFWSTGPQFTSDMVRAWFREKIHGEGLVRGPSKREASA
jgi:mannosyltransferase OCH1-like enzyme